MINPLLCTLWDGTNIWLQWDDAPGFYHIRLRFHEIGAEEWGKWIAIMADKRSWKVVPTWKEDKFCQAQVAVTADPRRATVPEEAWETAQEVTFQKSTCDFEISTASRRVHYVEGTEFSSVVDGAACHYRLLEEVDLEAGQRAIVKVQALSLSGYCQLDQPGDFLLRPYLGVKIQNAAPSVDDVERTGRDFGQLTRLPPEQIRVVFSQTSPLA